MQGAIAGLSSAATGNVVKAMEPIEFPQGDSDSARRRGRTDCVRREAAGRFAKLFLCFPYVHGISPGDHDAGALLQESARRGKAKASSAADDDERFAFEIAGSHSGLTLLHEDPISKIQDPGKLQDPTFTFAIASRKTNSGVQGTNL